MDRNSRRVSVHAPPPDLAGPARLTPAAQLRLALMDRDGPECAYCGVFLIPDNLINIFCDWHGASESWIPRDGARWPQVDHVVPRSRGGGDEPSNLALACCPCNSSKRDMPADEFRARRAAVAA